jgi:hypothetical protein
MSTIPLTPVTSDRTGTQANTLTVCTAGSNSYTFANGGNQIVRIKATAADAAVSVPLLNTVDGQAVTAKATPALTSSSDFLFGPFPVNLYGSTVTMTGPVLATTSFEVIQFVANT